MRAFRDLPISRKLTWVIMLCCAVTVLVGGGVLLVVEWIRFQHRIVRDLATQADLVGANCAAAVAFQDRGAAEQTLRALGVRREIVYACLYTVDGDVFAEYTDRRSGQTFLPPPLAGALSGFRAGHLLVFRPVYLGADEVGTIMLRSGLHEARQNLAIYMILTVAAMIVAMLVARVVAGPLQRLISDPLLELAAVAASISRGKDYTLRAAKHSNDEIGFLTDAFNRMLAEIHEQDQQRREHQELLESILNSMDEGVVAVDAKGRFVLFTPAAAEMLGQGLADVPPEEWPAYYGVFKPDQITPYRFEDLAMTRAMRGEICDRLELYIHSPRSGKRSWLQVTGRPLRDEAGQVRGGVSVLYDITEQRQVQEEYRRLHERFSGIYHSSKDGIAFTTMSGLFLDVNEAFERLTGYARRELLMGRSDHDLTPCEYHALELQSVLHTVQTDQPTEFEKEYIRKDGSRVAVELAVFRVLGEGGKPIGMATIVKDITGRKQAERALREAEERWRSLVTNSPDFILIADREGRISFVNRVEPPDTITAVVGTSIFDRLPVEMQPQARQLFERVFVTAAALQEEMAFPYPGEHLRWYSVRIVPITRAEGVSGALLIASDISQRKELERQVLEVSEQEQARIGRDLHDGLCQLLVGIAFAANSLQARLQQCQQPEERAAGEISELLHDAITQARTLSRVLHPVTLDVEGLEYALRELALSVNRLSGVACRLECTQPVLVADNTVATHLYRIVQEAVANAVKHAHAREIVIRLEPLDGAVRLEVQDDGVGLPAEAGRSHGMGIRSMTYRAHLLGAQLEIRRAEERGGLIVRCVYRPQPSRAGVQDGAP